MRVESGGHSFSQFESVVNDEVSDEKRLIFLKSCLSPEPLKIVSGIDPGVGCYKTAIDLLKLRYGNATTLLSNYVGKLLSLSADSPVSQLLDDFRVYSHQINSLVKEIEADGKAKKIKPTDVFLVPYFVSLLPSTLKAQWNRTCEGTDKFDMDKLLKFVDREISDNGDPSFDKGPGSSKISKDKRRSTVTLHARETSKKEKICNFCESNSHLIFGCPKCLRLSVEDRLTKVRESRLCLCCLSTIHLSNSCRSNIKCKHCCRRHNSLLHKVYTPQNGRNGSSASTHTDNPPGPSNTTAVAIDQGKKSYLRLM